MAVPVIGIGVAITLLIAATEGDLGVLDLLLDRFHVSGDEAKLARFLLDHVEEELYDPAAFRVLASRPNMPKHYVVELAALELHQDAWSDLLEWTVPSFPVRGGDLIAKGMKPGPEIGQTLARLRKAWEDSGFVQTKDDLMAMVA